MHIALRVIIADEDEASSPTSAAHCARRRRGIVASSPPPASTMPLCAQRPGCLAPLHTTRRTPGRGRGPLAVERGASYPKARRNRHLRAAATHECQCFVLGGVRPRTVLQGDDEAPSPSSTAHRTRRRGGIVTSAPPPPTSADVLYSEASSLGRRGLVDSSEVGLKVRLKRGPPQTRSASSEVDLSLGLDEVIEKIHACLSRVLQHTMIHVFSCSLASNYKGVQAN